MARKHRFATQSPAVFEVTARCFQARHLLQPGDKANDLIAGCLGRALKVYPDVKLILPVYLSNHEHTLLEVPNVDAMSAFMNHLQGCLATEIGRLRDWPDGLWQDRYHDFEILTEADFERKLRYVLAQGLGEGLIEDPRHWPGVHGVRAWLDGEPIVGTWYDRTAWHKALRKNKHAQLDDFAIRYEVPLQRPTQFFAHLDDYQWKAMIRRLVREEVEQAKETLRAQNRRVMPLAALTARDPTERPDQAKSSPMPLVHAATREERKAWREQYDAMLRKQCEARDALRAHVPACRFPEGGSQPIETRRPKAVPQPSPFVEPKAQAPP